MGKIDERPWTSVGSGSEYASNYIVRQGKLIPRGLRLREGIDLTVRALEEASQDIYTGGIDLVVLTRKGIEEFGPQIKDSMEEAKRRQLEVIKANYSR